VGSSNKRAIEDHFDMPSEDLLANLRAGSPSKQPYIEAIESIANMANFVYIRQKGPYGTATPALNAAHLLGDEPFIFVFSDDVTIAKPNPFTQWISYYEEFGCSILPSMRLSTDDEFDRYGVLAGKQLRDGVLEMTGIIEKPGKHAAPSNYASIGGYLLTSEVIPYLEKGAKNLVAGKEFYMTDEVIQPMLADGHRFLGCEIKNSRRYDTGNKLDYVKTVVDFALERKDIGPDLRAYLIDKLS
jgi:UTP--glucose-1-phosphate uridylyltransferase